MALSNLRVQVVDEMSTGQHHAAVSARDGEAVEPTETAAEVAESCPMNESANFLVADRTLQCDRAGHGQEGADRHQIGGADRHQRGRVAHRHQL